jgi:AcrR family transcriptional regulator
MNAQRYSELRRTILSRRKAHEVVEQTEQAGTGRVAQRRRTRRAILEATTGLLQAGTEPSVNAIAAAADVSRRTVYLYYPTLDQLVLDATIGTLNVDVDAALGAQTSSDPRRRLLTLVTETFATMETSLPLGRRLIKLTVDAAPPTDGAPRRGHRRIGWIEWAVAPVRDRLSEAAYDDLVSSLALVIGWEAFIVLLDVRGLTTDRARAVTLRTAEAILDAALAESPEDRGGA